MDKRINYEALRDAVRMYRSSCRDLFYELVNMAAKGTVDVTLAGLSRPLHLEPGQLAASKSYLVKMLVGATLKVVRNDLDTLERAGLISIQGFRQRAESGAESGSESKTRYPNKITIRNYDVFWFSIKSSKRVIGAESGAESGATGVTVLNGRLSHNLTAVLLGGVKGGSEEPPTPRPPNPATPNDKDKAVRDKLLDGLVLYQADPLLNRVDKAGKIAVVELYRMFRTLYPNVDVPAQIKQAHAWEVTEPNRRKKNRASFLRRWMKKESADGGVFRRGGGGPPAVSGPAVIVPQAVRAVVKTPPKEAEPGVGGEADAGDFHRSSVQRIGPAYCWRPNCVYCGKVKPTERPEPEPVQAGSAPPKCPGGPPPSGGPL